MKNNTPLLSFPLIEIKFGTCSQTNEQILSIYIKGISDAINAARGDYKALTELSRLFAEARYLAKDLAELAYKAQNEGAL
jgi:hypothetical protein